jgi:hypothetical protein
VIDADVSDGIPANEFVDCVIMSITNPRQILKLTSYLLYNVLPIPLWHDGLKFQIAEKISAPFEYVFRPSVWFRE